MAIDININNQNKHWILVILGKIKGTVLLIWTYLLKVIRSVGRFLKRIWKILVSVAALVVIIGVGVYCVDYYNNTYIPQKQFEEACSDIEAKFESKIDSIKLECSINILKRSNEWNYSGVNDRELTDHFYSKREDAFKFIESKAFAGDSQYQYILGQLYKWAGERYSYPSEDLVKAAYWWNEAALQGNMKAFNNLGLAYLNGWGVSMNKPKGIEYLKKGAEGGDDYSQWNYGNLYRDGVRVKTGSHKETRTTGESFFDEDRVIKKVWNDSKMTFITYYWVEVDDFEILVPKDIEQAKFWWKKSAAQGNEGAKECLQQIYN